MDDGSSQRRLYPKDLSVTEGALLIVVCDSSRCSRRVPAYSRTPFQQFPSRSGFSGGSPISERAMHSRRKKWLQRRSAASLSSGCIMVVTHTRGKDTSTITGGWNTRSRHGSSIWVSEIFNHKLRTKITLEERLGTQANPNSTFERLE